MAFDQDEALQGDIDEVTLLGILRAERENSVGFDYDSSLQEDRERALNYYKGDVSQDMPVLPNRSSVTSTDVADGVERALPDLIEIFASGDDGITFQAGGAEDEDLAKQETDYVRHVIFQQNKGFRVLYTMFKDALLSKVGVVKYYWDPTPEYQEYQTAVSHLLSLEELEQQGHEIIDIGDQQQDTTIPVTLRKMVSNGRVVIKAWAPEDFTVAEDTVDLCDTTYCAARSRMRVQELLADGHDPEKVATLTNDNDSASEVIELARDTVEETSQNETEDAAIDELRLVEIIEHYVRVDLEGTGKPQIWRIVTGNDEAVILEMEKRSRIEFAAITPYPMTHRFYGQSLADKLIEIQKWKTALIRMLNDSGYFALNQRPEVNVNKCTEDTIPALLDNQPGRPVPTQGDAIKNIETGGPTFDMLGAIEFANTVAEERTGIVRNAQGLDPDTLHDTATGAKILIGAAQKRLRMMARLFAETGIRDLFLGVHDLLRSNATMQDTIRLRNEWIEIDPQSWNRRKDVVIEIGVGHGGREEEIAKFDLFANRMGDIIEMQGGPGGIISEENIYAAADAYGDRLGIKGIERFITDPAQAEPQEEGPSEAEMMMQMEQQKFQAQHQLDMEKAQAALQLDQMKAEANANAQREKHALDMQLAREKAAQEAQLAREKMTLEAELAREKALIEASIRADVESAKLSQNRPGGSLAE